MTVRCTCFTTSGGIADPTGCPVHGQRTPKDSTTGALGGAPVVDLGLTIDGLFRHAEQCRQNRERFLAYAAKVGDSLAREADYLESLASTLAGLTTRSTPR